MLFSSHVLPEVEELAHRVLVLHRGRACAAGTLDVLQRTLEAETRLQVVLDPGASSSQAADADDAFMAAAAERLRAVAATLGIELLSHAGSTLEVRLDRPDARAALFQWLAESRLPVAEFRARKPDLEHLFRALVGGGEVA